MGPSTDNHRLICLRVFGTKEGEDSHQHTHCQITGRGCPAEYTQCVLGTGDSDRGTAWMYFFSTKHPLQTFSLLQFRGKNRDRLLLPSTRNVFPNYGVKIKGHQSHLLSIKALSKILTSCQKCAYGNIHIKRKRLYLIFTPNSSNTKI